MTFSSPMTFVNVGANAASRRLAAALLPLVVAIPLAVVGAFGSYVSMGLPLRVLHFSLIGLTIGGLALAISEALRRFAFPKGQPLWATILTAIALAPPGAVIVRESLRLFAPQALPHVSIGELSMQVLNINLFIGTVAWVLMRKAGQADAPALAEPRIAGESNALREKLPVALRHAAIVALSAEDHYVRVRTDRGQTLILMNLSDAIAALGDDAGVRIHRSHWIARELAAGVTPRSSRTGVRLDDTITLPISRAGRKLLNQL